MLPLLFCAVLAVVEAQGADAATTLADLEQRLARAWVERDRAFIEGLLAPDWSVTDGSGAVLSRQQVLDQTFASTDRRVDSMSIDDIRVRLFGATAVVTGRTRATGSYRGQSGTATLRFTDVFVFQNGRWLIVASHGSSVAP
jgi:hypothetical protein